MPQRLFFFFFLVVFCFAELPTALFCWLAYRQDRSADRSCDAGGVVRRESAFRHREDRFADDQMIDETDVDQRERTLDAACHHDIGG